MTTACIASDNYHVSLQNGRHEFSADEPLFKGGTDTGPDPDELLEASLASCTAITLRMYANRKQWPVATITVTVAVERSPGKTIFHRNILINGTIGDEARNRLLEIAKACPVSRILTGPSEILNQIS